MVKIGESSSAPHPYPEEEIINEIFPTEILDQVLFLLGKKDLQSASNVRKFWNQAALMVAKHTEFTLMKDLVIFLKDHLDNKTYEKQVACLYKIAEDINLDHEKTPFIANLIQVKYSLLGLKEKIVDALAGVKLDDLKAVAAMSTNEHKALFENLLVLIGIRREIMESSQKVYISNSSEDEDALQNIPKKLYENGQIENSVFAANSIPRSGIRGFTLRNQALWGMITDSLRKARRYEEAFCVANKIPTAFERGCALKEIALSLAKNGFFGKAIDVAITIPDPDDIDSFDVRESALRDIEDLKKRRQRLG